MGMSQVPKWKYLEPFQVLTLLAPYQFGRALGLLHVLHQLYQICGDVTHPCGRLNGIRYARLWS